MKRSTINDLIRNAAAFFESMNFHLPPWAFWTPDRWAQDRASVREIIDARLGWDITDFGSGDFFSTGLLLFTLRNGDPHSSRIPYAEKIMIVHTDQRTPMHFHWSKIEDIINRGGGDLVVEVRNSGEDEQPRGGDVVLNIDGMKRTVPAGGEIVLAPGESIRLEQRVYHSFYGRNGTVLVGEVSAVNDDMKDNRFLEPIGRFPEIEDDADPFRLLVSDYAKLP